VTVDALDSEALGLIELRSNLSRIFEEIAETRRTISGVPVSPETSLECAAVLCCVRVLAESLASMPMNVYRRLKGGGKEIADELWLHEVLAHQPNSWMTAFEFRELMMSWLLLWGNAYALIVPSSEHGAVSELIPLHPSRMEVKRLSNGKLRFYFTPPSSIFEPNPTVKEYRQDEIFVLRWLSSDGVKGYIPTTLNREAIALAKATELHSGAYFGNGGQPGSYFETSTPQKPETLVRFKDQYNEAHQGPGNHFKTFVVPFGFTYKQAEVRNDSAQLVETRRYQLAEVARCYRVPPHMVGDLKDVRFSTVEQSAIDFVTFSLIPWCRRWEAACRRDLVVDDKQYFVGFDVNSLMAGDYAARAQFIREMWNIGALDIDEVRAQIGYNPLEDGQGKKRFVQVNMQLLEGFTLQNPGGQPVDQAKQTPSQPAPEADTPPPENNTRDLAAAEVVFKTNLRRLAQVEVDGVLERRNKPEKLTAWLDQVSGRMREELLEPARATGRDIDQFVVAWMNRSRELLLECHRSGTKYETVKEGWCEKHLEANAAAA
jgi:HK97 family phage portal protein